jgi:hypothetical protein
MILPLKECGGSKIARTKVFKKGFYGARKCKKPTGDPDRPTNVTRAKQIEKMIEESVGMATINDAERGVSDSEDEPEDDESESESDSPAKERRPRPATVERLRTPREKITEQISQRDKIMTQVSSALVTLRAWWKEGVLGFNSVLETYDAQSIRWVYTINVP